MSDIVVPCGFDMIDEIYQDGSIKETLQKRVNCCLVYIYWLKKVLLIKYKYLYSPNEERKRYKFSICKGDL